MTAEMLIRILKEEQSKQALESLRKPNKRDSFEYGQRVGIVQGLEIVINKIVELHNKEENDDERVQFGRGFPRC